MATHIHLHLTDDDQPRDPDGKFGSGSGSGGGSAVAKKKTLPAGVLASARQNTAVAHPNQVAAYRKEQRELEEQGRAASKARVAAAIAKGIAAGTLAPGTKPYAPHNKKKK